MKPKTKEELNKLSWEEMIELTLTSLEREMWLFQADNTRVVKYSDACLRAATKIFIETIFSKMYALQDEENMDFEDRCKQAEFVGEEIKKLVKTHCNIDTTKLYKNYKITQDE